MKLYCAVEHDDSGDTFVFIVTAEDAEKAEKALREHFSDGDDSEISDYYGG